MAHEFKKESLHKETLVDSRLPCKRNPPFIFAHSPDNWEILDDGDGGFTMLPRIKCMRLEPGVNGIRGTSYDTVQPAMFFAHLRSEGWIVITDDVPVVYYDDGELVEDHGYLGSRPCKHGKVFCSVWDHPIISGAGWHHSQADGRRTQRANPQADSASSAASWQDRRQQVPGRTGS